MQKILQHIPGAYLLLLMAIKLLAVPIVCLQFAIDRDFIAENFCENKDRPAMHCMGSCQLNKKLLKTGQAEHAHDQKTVAANIMVDFAEPLQTIRIHSPLSVIYNNYPSLPAFSYPLGYYGNIFHPPLSVA